MRLDSAEGHSFELRIVGYQFPEEPPEEFDSDWLMIEGTARHPRGDWSFVDPCLQTDEVAELADWFERVANGCAPGTRLDFVEPNLQFELVGSLPDPRLRIDLSYESKPPWSRGGRRYMEDDSLRFRLAKIDLLEAAASLRRQLVRLTQPSDP